MSEEKQEKVYSPSEYFDIVKDKKNQATDEVLTQIYSNCLSLLNKAKITGQIAAARKMIFHLNTIEKEREIVSLGIDTFVYRDDIEHFIKHVADDVVKIIELEHYEREIPDDVVMALDQVKDRFDQFYIVFTDYTGEAERKVEKQRREKDPILFGTFQDRRSDTVIDRFYFIGDWEDEYCDLTLDKMVNQYKAQENRDIAMTITSPTDIDEYKRQLDELHPVERGGFRIQPGTVKKKGLFGKVKTFFTKSKS